MNASTRVLTTVYVLAFSVLSAGGSDALHAQHAQIVQSALDYVVADLQKLGVAVNRVALDPNLLIRSPGNSGEIRATRAPSEQQRMEREGGLMNKHIREACQIDTGRAQCKLGKADAIILLGRAVVTDSSEASVDVQVYQRMKNGSVRISSYTICLRRTEADWAAAGRFDRLAFPATGSDQDISTRCMTGEVL